MNMNTEGVRSTLKNGNELIFVGLVFFLASLFGLLSLFFNQGLIKGIYKTVDPGAGMLPLIIVAFITAGSLFYLICGFYFVYINKESINFTYIKFDKFTTTFFLSLIFSVYISLHISYIVSISSFMMIWLVIMTPKSELKNKHFLINLFICVIFIFIIVYVCFTKIMNTPFP